MTIAAASKTFFYSITSSPVTASSVLAGQTVTYTLSARCNSTCSTGSPTTGAVVRATMTASGFTVPSIVASTPANGTLSASGAVITWTLGNLTSTTAVTATFTVTVPTNASAGNTLTATASANGDSNGSVPSGSSAVSTVTVAAASIVVHMGGIRTSTNAVAALPAGATLQAVPVGGGTTLTCTSIAAGTCTFTNPVAGKQYDISQTGAPSGWYTNPQLDAGSSAVGSPRTYAFRTPAIVVGTNDVPGADPNTSYCDSTPSCPTSNNFDANTGNPFVGLWQTSLSNPSFPTECGLNIALVMDVSGSMALGGKIGQSADLCA